MEAHEAHANEEHADDLGFPVCGDAPCASNYGCLASLPHTCLKDEEEEEEVQEIPNPPELPSVSEAGSYGIEVADYHLRRWKRDLFCLPSCSAGR